MNLKVSDIINDSIVDGFGIRLTVFTQGCKHNCSGCHNPQTHSLENGMLVDTTEIVRLMEENPLLDGLTLSGGDPFEQAAACTSLATEAHSLGLNVWTYTGYTYEQLVVSGNEDFLSLLKSTDILIDGKFEIKTRSLELKFKGSRNQRLIDVKRTLSENKISELYL